MRILHLAHDYLARQVAGVEVYTSRLLTGQRRTDEPGIVVARIDPECRTGTHRSTTWQDVPCYEVVQNRDGTRFEQTWRDARLAPAFREIYSDFRPDLIHVQSLLHLTLAAVDAAAEARIPIVLTLHDHGFACAHGGQRFHVDRTRCERLDARRCARCTWASVGPIPALRATARRIREAGDRSPETPVDAPPPRESLELLGARRWLARHLPLASNGARIRERWDAMRALSDSVLRFVAPSRDMERAAIEFGFPAERVRYLPHGIPRPEPRPARTFGERAERFGYVGSLVPHKGVHHLVEAFASLPARARLDVYGSLRDAPGYVRELRARIRHPGIRLAGELPPEDVPAAMAGFDCLIAPSIWRENAPLGIQESFALGTPVVASDLGGHRELLAEGGGLLVPPGDEQALADALLRLATEPGLLQRIAARVPAPRTLAGHLTALRSIYEEAIDAADAPASASTLRSD